MADSVSTYINDHLAGASQAIDLLGHLRDTHRSDSLGEFASGLLVEILADRDKLRELALRIGTGSNAVKEMISHVAEKISRLKLGDKGTIAFGTFESLEFLVLGVHGKQVLWRALKACSAADPRLRHVDYDSLISRAEIQEETIETKRIEIAQKVLLSAELKTFIASPRFKSSGPRGTHL
jgi:hypothetical protein